MKNFFILLLITGCSIATFAQTKDFKPELYFGVKGGMTFSKVRFYPNVVESFQEGNSGGIMFRLISEPHIGFQVEVNYSQKGWKEDTIGYSRLLSYVSVPVMTHINFGDKAFRFTINLGPEVAYMISDEEKFISQTAILPTDPNYKTYFGKPIEKKFDFLFTAGIGFEYHLKRGGAFSLEGRAFYSLPNLFNPDNYPYKVSQSNGALVTFAYLFQFNKKKKASK
ncbi:MAG: porin family protein [Bacteroidia bacterium]|nr:porin family protein [Bacteroidia bacterium]